MDKTYEHSHISRCVIVTGMSGGGKSSALAVLEDQGFYPIDNLPPVLLPQLIAVLKNNKSAVSCGIAAVVDVREESLLNDLDISIASLKRTVDKVDLLFVDASNETLVRRYETTRRRHPVGTETTLLGSIAEERQMLSGIIKRADVVIDTTNLSLNDFKIKLLEVIGVKEDRLAVIFSSFGFKYGVPQDADYIFDVRFLPNPHYIPELHALTGEDEPVRKYLLQFVEFRNFAEKTKQLLEFVVSVYNNTGKKRVHIAFGCTGGQHRSVAICRTLAEIMSRDGEKVIVEHRDIDKESTL